MKNASSLFGLLLVCGSLFACASTVNLPPVVEKKQQNTTVISNLPADAIIRRTLACTVEVVTNKENDYRMGTGIIFKSYSKTYVITCAHVIAEDMDAPDRPKYANIVHRTYNQEKDWVGDADVVAYDVKQDWCVLVINKNEAFGKEIESNPGVSFDFSLFRRGTPIFHIGNFNWHFNSYTNGTVSNYIPSLGLNFAYQTNCQGGPGSSGGGIYTLEGKLVGIVCSQVAGTELIAIPIVNLKSAIVECYLKDPIPETKK